MGAKPRKYSFTFLKDLYLGGMSIENIGKQYRTCAATLAREIKAAGIMRPQGNHKYKHNENVFDKIDTEEKAYWLGFLYADGAINAKRPGVALGLAAKDLEHLKKFRDFISPEQTAFPPDKKNQVRLTVYNKHLYEKLVYHGCVPQKTFKLAFPTTVPDELIHHFIRGYFDGDGCVCIGKDGTLYFSILGTFDFLTAARAQFLKHVPGYTAGGLNKKGNVYTLQKKNRKPTQMGQLNHLLAYLYKDANVFLARKRKIAEAFLPSIAAMQ